MNQWMNKMERKFGKYAIPNLINYVVGIYTIGAIVSLFTSMGMIPDIYSEYLCLDVGKIFHGQVWRLFTFLIEPSGYTGQYGIVIGVLFLAIQINLFFFFGRSLTNVWGDFRFNVYVLGGYLLTVLGQFLLYAIPPHIAVYTEGLYFVHWAMFFAFALISPDTELLFMFVIPVKVKWLAILDGIYMAYNIIKLSYTGVAMLVGGVTAMAFYCFGIVLAEILSLVNFFLFYLSVRSSSGSIFHANKAQREYHKKTKQKKARPTGMVHKCAICGRTQEDAPDLDFRFCSKCNGNYEYCSEHLFTHEHVKKLL